MLGLAEYFHQRFVDELNDEGWVTVRTFRWPPAEVLQAMSPNDYEAHFLDWLSSQKQDNKDRAREFLDRYGCLERFNRLHSQLVRQSVMPFVGAGLSKSTGFPLWSAFLETLTEDCPSIRPEVVALLESFKYEEAAQMLLDHMGTNVFAENIQNVFGSRIKTPKGPIRLFPLIFRRGSITTNFDYLLNRVYEDSEARLKGEFSGSQLREAPRRIAEEPHCLLRLHGEADSALGRVLTTSEYDHCYGESGHYREVLKQLIANVSLLFVGCSLSTDRTLLVLREIKQAAVVESPRHFAFLPLEDGTDCQRRRAELGQSDIHPIWYPGDNHDQAIEDLLISLMDGGLHD
jgi:SIR2-like domain